MLVIKAKAGASKVVEIPTCWKAERAAALAVAYPPDGVVDVDNFVAKGIGSSERERDWLRHEVLKALGLTETP